jgi:hypothetical protein
MYYRKAERVRNLFIIGVAKHLINTVKTGKLTYVALRGLNNNNNNLVQRL